jgi:hypothetical protein
MVNKFLGKIDKTSFSKLVVSFALILSLFQPLAVLACGISLISLGDSWVYGNDSAEQSFINFENGVEKLLISRSFENGSSSAVWVIPVPASPNSIEVDVLSEIPQFEGYNVEDRALENLADIRDSILSTQVYPAIFAMALNNNAQESPGYSRTIPGASGGINQVVVYQHLEKEGMVAEVLSAASSDSLYDYLIEKGLKVEKNSIAVLEDYIGKDFSFVASWISPSAAGTSTRGLMMTFPSESIFYPLKPGSVYEGGGLPETVTVVGHVSPQLYEDIKETTAVNYFYSEAGLSVENFFTSEKSFGFTKIAVNAEPKKLTQDLAISQSAPLSILNAQLINLYTSAYGFGLFLIISWISTYLAGHLILALGANRPKLFRLGVANNLTIVGTIIGSRILLKEHRVKFVVSFSTIFVVVTWIVWFLLSSLYR